MALNDHSLESGDPPGDWFVILRWNRSRIEETAAVVKFDLFEERDDFPVVPDLASI